MRHVNPTLTGEDLLKLGVPKGPKVKEVLQKLREARLDGKIDSRKDEEDMVRKLSLPGTYHSMESM
jgi:tRNA nucleotidyltransferase (CCA-adding enzyme)